MTKYMVFNIGCIECGVSSNVVGIFTDIVQASQLTKQLQDTHHWREGGQNAFRVFELPEGKDNVVAEEYTKPVEQGNPIPYAWGDFEKDESNE